MKRHLRIYMHKEDIDLEEVETAYASLTYD